MKRSHAYLLSGASTAFAIFPQPMVTHYTREIMPLYTPAVSSVEALRGDWMKIGLDIHSVMTRQMDGQHAA